MLWSFIAYVASLFLSILIPIFSTLSSLHSPPPPQCHHEHQQHRHHGSERRWLAFWVVSVPFQLLERLMPDWLVQSLSSNYYYETKCLVFLWLLLPRFEGATWLYGRVVEPVLAAREAEIDSAVVEAKSMAKLGWVRVKRTGASVLRENAVVLLQKGQSMLAGLHHKRIDASAPPPPPLPPPLSSSSEEAESSAMSWFLGDEDECDDDNVGVAS